VAGTPGAELDEAVEEDREPEPEPAESVSEAVARPMTPAPAAEARVPDVESEPTQETELPLEVEKAAERVAAPHPTPVPLANELEEPARRGIASFAARIAEAERAARASPLSGFMSGPRRRSVVPAVALAAAIVLVVVIWRLVGADDSPSAAEPVAAADTTEAAGPGALLAGADPAGGRPGEVNLPYSVAIASYSSLDDALARQRGLNRAELPVYVAPTPVRGVVYYRVFAGIVRERENGEQLMAELVRRGIKDTVRAWDVRPARYAFFFGIYPTARDARGVVETLQGQGIPAYAVPAAAIGESDDPAYRVYAGGYETIEDAQPLRAMIVRAGLESELVERVGWLPQ
jgi:cell division septation protein DedD